MSPLSVIFLVMWLLFALGGGYFWWNDPNGRTHGAAHILLCIILAILGWGLVFGGR